MEGRKMTTKTVRKKPTKVPLAHHREVKELLEKYALSVRTLLELAYEGKVELFYFDDFSESIHPPMRRRALSDSNIKSINEEHINLNISSEFWLGDTFGFSGKTLKISDLTLNADGALYIEQHYLPKQQKATSTKSSARGAHHSEKREKVLAAALMIVNDEISLKCPTGIFKETDGIKSIHISNLAQIIEDNRKKFGLHKACPNLDTIKRIVGKALNPKENEKQSN